jgi:multidrug transporter EmrE-like cation transporter
MRVKNILLCAAYLFFAISGLTFMKLGGQDKGVGISLHGIVIGYKMIAGMICYAISFLLYSFAISQMNISFIIPILGGLTCCLAVVVGAVVFKEELAVGQIIGAGIIALGIVIMKLFD